MSPCGVCLWGVEAGRHSKHYAKGFASVCSQPTLGGSTPLGCCSTEIQLHLHHYEEGSAPPCMVCSYHHCLIISYWAQQPMPVPHVSSSCSNGKGIA